MPVAAFESFSAAEWSAVSAIAAAVTALVVVVSALIATKSLGVIRRTHELQAVERFFEFYRESETDRQFIFQDIDLLDPNLELTSQQLSRIRNVLNTLNRIGLL